MNEPCRIIIAEDNESVSYVLTRLILRHRPDVVVWAFANGQAALVGYQATGADLLFCNHAMPGMDGPTLIRILRAQGETVPIIGISGDPSLRDVYMAAGAEAFVGGTDLILQLPALLRRFLPLPEV